MSKLGISERAFRIAANEIGCEVASIKAVDKVESRGSGFLKNGHPKILFEPHIFWKELRKLKYQPRKSSLCYPKWGTYKYGKVSEQPARLDNAIKEAQSYLGDDYRIREAGLKSCSWGRFQIMGFNYKLSGCATIQEFINGMYDSEEQHLMFFVNYIKNTHLDDELRGRDWKGFARGYNGPAYHKNQYDIKLRRAYNYFSQ